MNIVKTYHELEIQQSLLDGRRRDSTNSLCKVTSRDPVMATGQEQSVASQPRFTKPNKFTHPKPTMPNPYAYV